MNSMQVSSVEDQSKNRSLVLTLGEGVRDDGCCFELIVLLR